MEVKKQESIRVRREQLLFKEQGSDRKCGFLAANKKIKWKGKKYFKDSSEWIIDGDDLRPTEEKPVAHPRYLAPPRKDRLLLSIIGTQPFVDLAEALRVSCVYNFTPKAIQTHQPIMGTPFLANDGRNLARCIEGLREIEPETLLRIGAYLKTIVPEVKSFRRVEYGDFETVRFTMESLTNDSPVEFDASSMSDGTLRTLATLLAAFQIVLPNGFPGFIAIEEPETSLHPAAIRALVDALDEATLRTQILLTSHSSEILDAPPIRPFAKMSCVVRNTPCVLPVKLEFKAIDVGESGSFSNDFSL